MRKHGNRKLWYATSASYWEEALPLGNGRLGAMLFGGIDEDVISLNEDTFWSGFPKKHQFTNAPVHYKKARDLAMRGRYEEAQREIEENLTGEFSDCYLPLGDIRLFFPGLKEQNVTAYERYLCLENAISGSGFVCKEVTYQKEAFISWPEQAMYMKITADKPEKLHFCVNVTSQIISESSTNGNRLILSGTAPGYAAPNYVQEEEPIRYGTEDCYKGMRFCIMLSVETDGELVVHEKYIEVQKAKSAVLRCCAATSFNGFDKHPYIDGKDEIWCCSQNLCKAETVEFEKAKERHILDYRQYFDRMDWRISCKEEEQTLPTDERLHSFHPQKTDVGLYELFFHFGRYLLISSSRPGTQATNLQGIWNARMRAAWSSNYTLNINTQMNYWPVEICGLPELHEPLFDLIEELGMTGAKTAEILYGARGFTAHHNTDIWRLSTPTGRKGKGTARYAFWPMAAGWLCRHLFEHYEYTLEETFLRERAYPLIQKAAQFYLDVMTEDENGELIFAPATSPENRYMNQGFHGAAVKSAAMTQSIIREVFEECVACAQVLGESGDWIEEVKKKKALLKGIIIGEDGRILEWNESLEEPEVQHRHISHLYGLYPGNQINGRDTPKLAKACQTSLETRGDGGTGWSLSWKSEAWVRLGKGDHALKLIGEQLRIVKPEDAYEDSGFWCGGGVYANLFDAHPPFQIDGNFGTLAGIAEMYLQSTQKEIHLLPALPEAFGESVIRGLCAKGRIKADLYVCNGRIKEAIFYTDVTQERTIICQGKQKKILLEAGIPFIYKE